MSRTCPKCDDQQLAAVVSGVSRCLRCGGSFVRHGAAPDVTAEAADSDAASTDAQGGRCPTDRTVMTRTEIDLGPDRPPMHLERCGSCRSIWFDAGEWSALAERQLLEHLDDFWSLEWRNSQRRTRDKEAHERRTREEFGPELYAELLAIASRLRGHERRSQALAFLREASDD
jgi:Zn-finger nucleic acid-binding protein